MRLELIGHDYKYAVEQILLSLFPEERPHYSSDLTSGSSEPFTRSVLSDTAVFAQATTTIHYGGNVSRGVSKIRRSQLTDKLITDRLLQSIIKQSFYKAAIQLLPAPPQWGSLTGIRPAQIAAKALTQGSSPQSASRLLTDKYHVSAKRADMATRAAQAALKLKGNLAQNDISLYVGIPFCPTRCTYCSFVSNSVEKSFDLMEPFVSVLLREIETAGKTALDLGLRVRAVYFGGGTPTTLPDAELKAVMAALQTAFDLSDVSEYTFEAGRPDTITREKLKIICSHGADRICVNPQSMSDNVLKAIGRAHGRSDVLSAASLVRETGAALNVDIIAGLPSSTPEDFKDTVDTLLGLKPENVTVHTLSLKKGSKIMLEGTKIPSGEEVSQMLDYASSALSGHGYSPYYLYRQKFTSGGFENTGWCLPGYMGIYNVCMMEELCTVIALGGGGVTKLVLPSGRIERIFNAKYPREYIMFEENLPGKYGKIRDFIAGDSRLQEV
ncbi:MAG: coproporphyrinogen dehydrogenase HemZ [Oscillospiraceae bacterium]|nr:coproporphyrinogen dehydrogenase HemZ [Oscillospiraceae bacterium]